MLTSLLSGPDPAATACKAVPVPAISSKRSTTSSSSSATARGGGVTRASSTGNLLGGDTEAMKKRASRRSGRRNGVSRTNSASGTRALLGSRSGSDRSLSFRSSGGSSSSSSIKKLQQRDDSSGRKLKREGSGKNLRGKSAPLGPTSSTLKRNGSSSNLFDIGMEAVGAVQDQFEGAMEMVQDQFEGAMEMVGIVDSGPTMEEHMNDIEDFLRVVKGTKQEDRNKILQEAIVAQSEIGKKAKRTS